MVSACMPHVTIGVFCRERKFCASCVRSCTFFLFSSEDERRNAISCAAQLSQSRERSE